MSLFDLTGRVAIVTGGNGGIGLGIAQALNAQGCNVSIWGRNPEKNKAAAATMSAGPGKVHTEVCHVSDSASVKAAMQATLDTFGRAPDAITNAYIVWALTESGPDDDVTKELDKLVGQAKDAKDLEKRIRALPGFGDMKVLALSAVLSKRFGVEVAKPLAPSFPTLGDVDSVEALHEYQAAKRAHKAAVRAARAQS